MSTNEFSISFFMPRARDTIQARGMPKASEQPVAMNAIWNDVASELMISGLIEMLVPIERTYIAGKRMKNRKKRMARA